MHRLGYERFLAPVELCRSRSARQDDHAAHIGSNFEVVFWPSLRWPAQDTGAMGGPGRANNSMTKVGWGRDLGLVKKKRNNALDNTWGRSDLCNPKTSKECEGQNQKQIHELPQTSDQQED